MTAPRPWYSSEPGPGRKTSGSMPRMLVRVLMKIGRRRLSTPATTASFSGNFSFRMKFSVWATTRMALLTMMPIMMMKPSIVTTSSIGGDWFMTMPFQNIMKKSMPYPPTTASGTLRMMTSGSEKLSKRAAIRRYVMTRASTKLHCMADHMRSRSLAVPRRSTT